MPGVKACPAPKGSPPFFCIGHPQRAIPYSTVSDRALLAYLPRERDATSSSGKLRIAPDENIKVVRNLMLLNIKNINKPKKIIISIIENAL